MAKASDAEAARPWYLDNWWKVGLVLVTAAGWVWQRNRQARISVDRVSERWLMDHEIEEGRGRRT